jgi:hypothetical protein
VENIYVLRDIIYMYNYMDDIYALYIYFPPGHLFHQFLQSV